MIILISTETVDGLVTPHRTDDDTSHWYDPMVEVKKPPFSSYTGSTLSTKWGLWICSSYFNQPQPRCQVPRVPSYDTSRSRSSPVIDTGSSLPSGNGPSEALKTGTRHTELKSDLYRGNTIL